MIDAVLRHTVLVLQQGQQQMTRVGDLVAQRFRLTFEQTKHALRTRRERSQLDRAVFVEHGDALDGSELLFKPRAPTVNIYVGARAQLAHGRRRMAQRRAEQDGFIDARKF